MLPDTLRRVPRGSSGPIPHMDWLTMAEYAIAYFKIHKEPPFIQNTAEKVVNTCALSICCSPCIIWSTLCRMVCCPFSCTCSSNCCTHATDNCVMATAEENARYVRLPAMPPISTFDVEQKLRLVQFMHDVSVIFNGEVYREGHYELATCLFAESVDTMFCIPQDIRKITDSYIRTAEGATQ